MGHSHGVASLPQSLEDRRLLRFRLGAVLVLALAATGAQFLGAFLTGSIALLADSVHMVVDLLGLVLAFCVSLLPHSRSEEQRLRFEAFSALVQSSLLTGVGVYALIRGLQSLISPHPVAGGYMLIFASVGLLANLACVAILSSARRANLNLRAAFLEVLSDGIGSLLVISAGIAVLSFGFYQADGIAALGLGLLMVPRGLSILRLSLREIRPRLPRLSLTATLIAALLLGLGTSQLHQLIIPPHLDLIPSPVDQYGWSQIDGDLILSFDGESRVATLTDGCSTLRASYAPVLGGVGLGGFAGVDGAGCEPIPESVREAPSAYYSEDFRELRLYSAASETLVTFGSEERSADQDRRDFWDPLVLLLFRL